MVDNPKSERAREAIDEVRKLLETQDADVAAHTAASRILAVVAPGVDALCGDVGPTISVSLVCRCVLRRAEETLGALTRIPPADAYAGMGLLRPMVEDYIFVRYLRSRPRALADEFIVETTRLEISEGIRAQQAFFPKARERFARPTDRRGTSSRPHLPPVNVEAEERSRSRLKALGEEMGWGRRVSPPVRHMADQTGTADEYDFFFRGCSRAVHSNLHHLLRMVWGRDDHFSITNRHFAQYYRRFSLTYGVWLLMHVIDAVVEELPEFWDHVDEEAYSIWLAFAIVPAAEQEAPAIVTKDELRWPS